MKYLNKFNESRYIRKIKDYTPPDGWVNVKIDHYLFQRMEKYVYDIDYFVKGGKLSRNKYNLHKKLDVLAKIDSYLEDTKVSIQKKISLICILQYLKELRDHFDPSSSGFLLEGFLATLIHGKIIKGREVADISTSYDELDAVEFDTKGHKIENKVKYQIKLYKKDASGIININFNEVLDYYVICLKDGDNIDVHILVGNEIEDPDHYIGKFASRLKGTDNWVREKITRLGKKKFFCVKMSKLDNSNKSKQVLNVGKLDDLILKCGEKIKDCIANVYNSLSDLSYDIDSLVTGRTPSGTQIDVDTSRMNAIISSNKIKREIDDLTKEIKK